MQVQTGLSQIRSENLKYSGSFNVIQKIYKEIGFKGVFKGIDAILIRNIITFAAYFTQYELFCNMISSYSGQKMESISLLHSALAGGIVGSLNWALTYPLDTFKSVSQTDCPINPKYSNYI